MKINKSVIIGAAAIAIAGGCQTRITAQKFPEDARPFMTQGPDGLTLTNGYQVLSGGWYVTARSPLWANESLKGLSVGTKADGSVHLTIDDYSRDLSTNSVAMVKEIFIGSTNLVSAVGIAYSRIAGGAGSDAIATVANKAVALFRAKGGDESKASVSCDDGSCSISDGSVCVSCDVDGNCTAGACGI